MPRPAAERRAEALRRLLLVAVTDRGRCRGDLAESCEAAVRGGATAVLLRDRDLPRGERRRLARVLRASTRAAGAALLVHSDAALAREVDADGVHLDSRADAAAIRAARRDAGPGRIVGVSTHSRAEVLRAARGGADYAFLGPVAATASHPGESGIGWRWFAVAAGGSPIPVLPIGGVDEHAPAGRAAAIGAILGARDPAKGAAMILRALAGAPPKRGPRPLLDERSLVERFLRAIGPSPGLALGPGDDAVVLRDGGLAVATDMTVEGVHYRKGVPARAAGFKAASRALSDLAAVGAAPGGLMVGIAARDTARARGIQAGARAAARRAGIAVVGGDTKATRGSETVAVTALGLVEGAPALPRSGGRAGDALFVTGPLGGSIRGRHLRPRPRLDEGLVLRRRRLASACIDISDGLATDLHRLCRASAAGALIEAWRVPVHADARRGGGDPIDGALFDGEDYELLFAVPPAKAALVEARGVAGCRVFRIGRLLPAAAGVVVQQGDGTAAPLPDRGWVHFRRRDR